MVQNYNNIIQYKSPVKYLAIALSGLLYLYSGMVNALDADKKLLQQMEQQQQQINVLQENLATLEDYIAGGSSSNNTSIGGYGELHYNAGDTDRIDFHRFVLYFTHDYTDSIRFISELELEHSLAGEGQPGEIELEQAYIEFDLNDQHKAKAGLFLVPVGILNEYHEPNTFYGVERNNVEKYIIPTTWWEAGAAISGKVNNSISYDAAIHSGLKADKLNIRSGRQKVANAVAKDGAVTGRLSFHINNNINIDTSVNYQHDLLQSSSNEAASALMHTVNTRLQYADFRFTALYAAWDIDGKAAQDNGKDKQVGWYLEPAYQLNYAWGIFARLSSYDLTAGNDNDSKVTQKDIGINYWPHEKVVLKADYAIEKTKATGEEEKTINLGVGYQF